MDNEPDILSIWQHPKINFDPHEDHAHTPMERAVMYQQSLKNEVLEQSRTSLHAQLCEAANISTQTAHLFGACNSLIRTA